MQNSVQIAQLFRGIYFGGNWTASNLKDSLVSLTLQQATTKIHDFNTIAILLFHIHYYVKAVTKVLEGQSLKADDKFSFDLPNFSSEKDWQNFKDDCLNEGEKFALLVKQFPDTKLNDFISEEKYGTFYRNFHGIIEHAHYHLGQIVLIKKLVLNQN